MWRSFEIIRSRTISTICLALFAIVLQNGGPSCSANKLQPVCDSRDCLTFAVDYLLNMNKNAKPCNNFYSYVCQRWGKNHPKVLYEDTWTTVNHMFQNAFRDLKKMLEDKSVSDDPQVERVKRLFRICMNKPYVEISQPSVVKNIMTRAGPWPMMLPKNSGPPKGMSCWQLDQNYMAVTGESAFFEHNIFWSSKPPFVFQPMFTALKSPYGMLERNEGWVNKIELKNYNEFLTQVITSVATRPIPAQEIRKSLDNLNRFREELRKIIEQSFEEYPEEIAINSFQQWYDKQARARPNTQVNWLHVVKNIYKNAPDLAGNVKPTTQILISKLYISRLIELLFVTSHDTIANHVHVYFAERHLQLNEKMRMNLKESVANHGEPTGRVSHKLERWQRCLNTHNMMTVISKMYIKGSFTPREESAVKHLFEKAKEVLVEQFARTAWVDERTKANTIRKIKSIRGVIGYSDWYTNGTELAGQFPPMVPDANYGVETNVMNINVANLKPPIFSLNLPYVVHYGALVSEIGHELYHAVDTEGVRYDENGKMPFWSDAMRKRLTFQSKCFERQYTKYRDEEFKKVDLVKQVEPPSTLNEDIADVMGLKLAYLGYRKELKKNNGVCPVLPGFERLGCEKLFFIAFANTWCESMSPGNRERDLMTDWHSVSQVRVNGAVANMPEFSEAFQCKPTDRLRLKEPCDLWK